MRIIKALATTVAALALGAAALKASVAAPPPSPSSSPDWRAAGPTVPVMTYRATPAERPKLRLAMHTVLLLRLARLHSSGDVARSRLGATSPAWKAFSDNKTKIRTEKQPPG